jgi:two-component system sensor histidine kinase/response regulator
MSEVTDIRGGQKHAAERADELLQQQRDEIYRNTDVLLARLMVFQWLAAIIIAVVVSPYTWSGQSSEVHLHVWAAAFLGGAITIFPVWLTRIWPGAAFTRYVIAAAQMLMSALLISLTGGRIETHFHVFGSLVILSFYRDWRVLIPATIVVALDHFVRGIYWPHSVYGVLTASPWRSIEHAGWVVFEDVFLVISCLSSVRQMRFIANRTAALESSEQNFRQIFEEAPIGMAVVDLDNQCERANAALCQMLGYSEAELVNSTPPSITCPEDVEQSAAQTKEFAQAMLTGSECSALERRYLRKNGETIWTMRAGCVIRDPVGAPRHFLIMVEDITERKKSAVALQEAKDEAERANRAKSEFLSRMSHELRTPLNAILGFGQLLERQNPTNAQRERVGHILGAGRHLLDLINEVLDISRIEVGGLQLSLEPVCIGDALGEAIDLMRPLAAERSIVLRASADLDRTSYVMADRQRLKQVLLNLLGNAVKYTPTNGRVTASYNPCDGNKGRIAISDNGTGIPAESLSRLFIPFDRLGAEQSDVQGTGLGLALCKRLAQAMRGSIGVESTVGRGSTFWIELPRVTSPLAEVKTRRNITSRQKKQAAGPDKRIVLYIEDNLSNLTLIEQMLEDQPDVELVTATQGKAGLDLARQYLPDLVLLDLHLPDLPGWEVLAELRANEATAHIPIIVISADATEEQVKRLTTAGANAYLTKPVDMVEFLRLLKKTTSQPKKPRELAIA